jgi:heptosyltransferase-2
MERILVKELNWLGDIVMSLPALHALRQAFPQSKVSVLIKRSLATFFDGSDWLEEVIPYEVSPGLAGVGDRRKIVAELRDRQFDLAVLFPKSFEAAFWVASARVPRRIGFSTQGRSLLLTDRLPFGAELRHKHQTFDYLHLLHEALGIDGDASDCTPTVHRPHRDKMSDWLGQRRRRSGHIVALAAAAAYGPAKEWPVDHYAALIDLLAERYDTECVLVGGPAELAKCDQVVSASRHGGLVAAGQTSVGEAMALLSLCDGFVGNDSGSMHVAGALGIPTVGIYGSTNPQRTSPLGSHTRVLYDRIECSPCLERTCRFGHYGCLKRIEAEHVIRALEQLGAFGRG